jgi:phosphoinositide-3-kinase regulatory subunit 4
MYLDSNREYQNDFGPRVHEGPIRRRNAVRHSFTSRDGSLRRSEATLIAHLAAHTDAVTSIAVAPDHMFFVSGSDDKTVKVWDTARLERNVTSKPRHAYTQHHARVKCVCMLEALHCFASAAEDGSMHVVRVHASVPAGGALPKYPKLQTVREYRLDRPGEHITCMAHFNTGKDIYFHNEITSKYALDSSSNLVYTTTHSSISLLDLRTMRVLQTLEQPLHNGPITAMCLDRKCAWVLTGTATGVLTLWDIRFGLRLKSWKTATASAGAASRVYECVAHPSREKGRWVMVALESTKPAADGAPTRLIEVWDIEHSTLVETFATHTGDAADAAAQKPEPVVTQDAEPSAAAAISALVRARQQGAGAVSRRASEAGGEPPRPSPDVRALLVGAEFGGHSVHRAASALGGDAPAAAGRGFMITGSEDRRLRLWDLGRVERTRVLSGNDGDDKPSYACVFTRLVCLLFLTGSIGRNTLRTAWQWSSKCGRPPHKRGARRTGRRSGWRC